MSAVDTKGDATPLSREQNALQALEAIPDAIFRVSSTGTILYYQPSSINLFGVGHGDELTGRSVFEFPQLTPALDAALVEHCLRQVQLAIEQGQAQCFEVQLKRGQWPLWLEIRAIKVDPHEAVVIIREVGNDRRHRAIARQELAENRALVRRLYEEERGRQQALAAELEALAARTPTEIAAALQNLARQTLTPAGIAPEALPEAIHSCVETICIQRPEVRVRMDLAAEHLDQRVATHIHQVVNETLRCIVEHSSAEHVRLSLVNTAEMLSLTVSDDDPTGEMLSEQRGICVAKLRFYTEELGGTLTVIPGRRGTAVRLRLPLGGDKTEPGASLKG